MSAYNNINHETSGYNNMLETTSHPIMYTGVSPPLSLTSTYHFPLDPTSFHTPEDRTTYYYGRY